MMETLEGRALLTVVGINAHSGRAPAAIGEVASSATDRSIDATPTDITMTIGQMTAVRVASFSYPGRGAKAGDFTASVSWGGGLHGFAGPAPGYIIANKHGGFDVFSASTVTGSTTAVVQIVHTKVPHGVAGATAAVTSNVTAVAPTSSTLATDYTNIIERPSSQNPRNIPITADFALDPFGDQQQLGNAYTATIHWGDGSPPSAGTVTYEGLIEVAVGPVVHVAALVDVAGTHHYRHHGVHFIHVTLQAKDLSGTADASTVFNVV